MALSYTERPAVRGRIYGVTSDTGTRQPEKKSRAYAVLSYFFPVKGDSIKEGVRKVIFTGALACFIYFGTTVGLDLYGVHSSRVKQQVLEEAVGSEVAPEVAERINSEQVKKGRPSIIPDFMALYSRNPDFIGWISLDKENDIINYPVCQAKDNDYYLHTDFDGNYNKGGTIFADYRCKFNGFDISDNTVLYGHNIISGDYFAKLTRYYTDISFYKEHPVVTFDTLYEKAEWKVFACVLFNTQEKYGEVYPYLKTDLGGKDEFETFILDIMDRSVLLTDVDIRYGDDILTLSTCYYPLGKNVDSRCAVFARKVREGEKTYVDTSAAVYNKSELRWAEQAKRLGTNWRGRVWDTSKLIGYNE